MKLNGSKKILLLGLILIIIAGIVVVALKGFNVDLAYEQHESINMVIGKEVNISEFEEICREVFGNKKFIVRSVELFGDAVNVDVESITDEEKGKLVEFVNNKYQTEFTVEGLSIKTVPNVRLRDIIRPYLIPIVISSIIIVVYMVIRFRKIKATTLLGKVIAIVVLTEAAVASVISIARIPLTPTIINVMFALAILELVLYIDCKEKEYRTIKK